jgi:N-acetylglutamate synthase-like GNAT family acetyltransferase
LPVSNFQLRPATQSNFASIRKLIHLVGINPTGLDWRRFLVAITTEGVVVGCGQIKLHRDGSRELASIAVHPDWRGRGVARAIIERLIANHSSTLFLTCRAGLKEFYEKFGFSAVKPEEMPAHFRRITRLVNIFLNLNILREGLLVMALPEYDPSS